MAGEERALDSNARGLWAVTLRLTACESCLSFRSCSASQHQTRSRSPLLLLLSFSCCFLGRSPAESVWALCMYVCGTSLSLSFFGGSERMMRPEHLQAFMPHLHPLIPPPSPPLMGSRALLPPPRPTLILVANFWPWKCEDQSFSTETGRIRLRVSPCFTSLCISTSTCFPFPLHAPDFLSILQSAFCWSASPPLLTAALCDVHDSSS
mmetsp:Transcript_15362/g.22500  ORF Transcript_15362/g.22500 Transcript_15362/m.22500 type:complete len:208 (-) Transcript_15362:745-1368(-)